MSATSPSVPQRPAPAATPAAATAALPPLAGGALAVAAVALSTATFMNVLDTTIANVSLPAIAESQRLDPLQLEPVLHRLRTIDWVAWLQEAGRGGGERKDPRRRTSEPRLALLCDPATTPATNSTATRIPTPSFSLPAPALVAGFDDRPTPLS